MKKYILAIVLFALSAPLFAQGWDTPFEQSGGKESATYEQAISYYKRLEESSPFVKVIAVEGGTDVGVPLHYVLITNEATFHPVPIQKADKRIIFINNGIHAGEPCGVDASMMLARDMALEPRNRPLLDHVALVIIPFYNAGGGLNRGCCSRANQVGPEQYGFRGNGRNLDLNRDFIKRDSRNARTFAKIFAEWRPDIFIDTHTTNGADYPYTLTYIAPLAPRLHPALSEYVEKALIPTAEKSLGEMGYEMTPYVNMLRWSMPPDSGLAAFYDTPRYATGYSQLFNCISFTTEAHMLKTFDARVRATYAFLFETVKLSSRDWKLISRAKKEADAELDKQTDFVLRYELDMEHPSMRKFKGYAAEWAASMVTGFPRLSYNRGMPYEKEIPYYDVFKPALTVKRPQAYIIPQSWGEVPGLMALSGVEVKRLSEDIEVPVERYRILSWKDQGPYEGHYLHYDVEVEKVNETQSYRKGDYVIYTDQWTARYIIETLEPHAPDSYLAWNYFDEILARKEYFSPYIFEKEALELLAEHPEWRKEMDQRKAQDSTFAQNDYAQLMYIYERSEHAEASFRMYPVARYTDSKKLPLVK